MHLPGHIFGAGQRRGPYSDHSTAPLVCQLELGGSIDPSPFVDSDGQPYLLWKSDDNAIGRPTTIWSQALDANGLSFAAGSSPTALLSASQNWEGGIIEGPTMVQAEGTYHLFYGANGWDTARAGMGWATCSPFRPLHQAAWSPLGSD